MFPPGTKTFYGNYMLPVTEIFEDSDEFTILSINSEVTSNNNSISVRCGNEVFYSSNHDGYGFALISRECIGSPLSVVKTGNAQAVVNITYVPYSINNATSTAETGYNPSSDISSSSDVQIYGSISAGEFIISLFLFMILLFKIMELIAKGLSGITVQRKLMRYSGGDVPVDND